MFNVDPTTKTITMHRGDTGEMSVTGRLATFSANDRALFTVKNSSGTEIIKRVYELEDGQFTVAFANADTDSLPPGTYYWDVRFIFDPHYVDEEIDDGAGVDTPGSPYLLNLLSTVGQV